MGLKYLESELLPGDRLCCRVNNGAIPLCKEFAMAKESMLTTSRAVVYLLAADKSSRLTC